MKKKTISIIGLITILAACAIGVSVYYALETVFGIFGAVEDAFDNGNIGSQNKPNKPIKPPIVIPDKPPYDIPMPTLPYIKNNYDAKSLGVDIDAANNYPNQTPLQHDSNSYFIQISEKKHNQVFNEQTGTLYLNFDPMLSQKNQEINLCFAGYSQFKDDYEFVDKIRNIVIYLKSIPEGLLKDNFYKGFKITFEFDGFLGFFSLENLIIYEQEQSCFKSPNNTVVSIGSDELPSDLINFYSDASIEQFSRLYENKKPTFTSLNLKKFIFDVGVKLSNTSIPELNNIDFLLNDNAFLNTEAVELFSTFSFKFESYEQMELFKNKSTFMQLNPNYDGFKIPYYLDYTNPLEDFENGTFNSGTRNSIIVFLWDKYFSRKELPYSSIDLINYKLFELVGINYNLWN